MSDLMNSTSKTNEHLGRGLITGITRVSRESVFSDLNNLEVVTTSSAKYRTTVGFTEEETFAALDEYGLSGTRGDVRKWYDGFTFGGRDHVYNPWSVTKYLESGAPSTPFGPTPPATPWPPPSCAGRARASSATSRCCLTGGTVERVIDE